MKYLLLLSFLPLVYNPLNNDVLYAKHLYTLTVNNEYDRPLEGVNYRFSQSGVVIREGLTDMKGQSLIELEEGYYTIVLSYPGYMDLIMTGYKLSAGNTSLEFTMAPKGDLEEITISSWPLTKERKALDMSSPDVTGMRSPAEVTLRGYSAGSAPSSSAIDLPGSGQVTAGEWNDLNNWSDWKKLINDEDYKHMQTHWGINTLDRYAVVVVNSYNIPIPGAMVSLLDRQGKELWQSYTDVSGKAELWNNAYTLQSEPSRIVVRYNGSSEVLRQIRKIDQGAMVITIENPCIEKIAMDIAFVVDATSSMSDEIRYLQSELLDVIERVKDQHHNTNWASVFYRDKDDEYITRKQPFSEDPIEILNFIKGQNAAGGGDFPEAVTEAMDVAINSLGWRKESNVKLCFLLLDAPPHHDESSMSKYKQYIRLASSKGIKIIPVTASGINRETEFLMKFTAMLTNGTYVFITDDSGIGNPHLDPAVKDYEVEKLNDMMVRLISSYSRLAGCEDIPAEQILAKLKYYPNPAVNFLNIENGAEGDNVYILSTSGKIVSSHQIDGGGTFRIDLTDLISGSYILRWTQENDVSKDFPLLIIK